MPLTIKTVQIDMLEALVMISLSQIHILHETKSSLTNYELYVIKSCNYKLAGIFPQYKATNNFSVNLPYTSIFTNFYNTSYYTLSLCISIYNIKIICTCKIKYYKFIVRYHYYKLLSTYTRNLNILNFQGLAGRNLFME